MKKMIFRFEIKTHFVKFTLHQRKGI